MPRHASTFRRWFALATILVSVHTALVVAGVMALHLHSAVGLYSWFLVYYADYPATLIRKDFTTFAADAPVLFCILGLLYWGLIGLLLQSAWRWMSAWWQQRHEVIGA